MMAETNPGQAPVISSEQVGFGKVILSRLHEFHAAEPADKVNHTFGFIDPSTGLMAEAVIETAIPHYERKVQEGGIFLLEHSEVSISPTSPRNIERAVQ
jgi:hypothetical protein